MKHQYQTDRAGQKFTVRQIKEKKDYSFREEIKDWVFESIKNKEIPDVDVPVDKEPVIALRPKSKETKVF